MSKEQIEEMAVTTCSLYRSYSDKPCAGDRVCDFNCHHYNRCEKLYEKGYRKQSENVIELPCKVGTAVYVIEPLWYGIWGEDDHKCRKCEHFYEGGMGDPPDCDLGKNCCYQICEKEANLRKLVDWITPSEFTGKIAWGKTVFLTREEAEAHMKGEKE